MPPNRLKELRRTKGVSVAKLAEKVGLSRPYLSQLENGQRNLSVSNLEKIAFALGVAPRELLSAKGNANDLAFSDHWKNFESYTQMAELLSVMSNLSDKDRGQVIEFAKDLRSSKA